MKSVNKDSMLKMLICRSSYQPALAFKKEQKSKKEKKTNAKQHENKKEEKNKEGKTRFGEIAG